MRPLTRTTWTSDQVKEFFRRLELRAGTMKDYLVPRAAMRFDAAAGDVSVSFGTNGDARTFALAGRAHDHAAQLFGIPKPYYDRCRTQAPSILTANLNGWTAVEEEKAGEKRMVRTIEGRARALLSPHYRILDSWDVVAASLQQLGHERAEVLRAYADDDRMALTAIRADVTKSIEDSQGNERALHPGVRISNDETGGGALVCEPFVFDGWCTNGLTYRVGNEETAIRFVHQAGSKVVAQIILSERTRRDMNAAMYGAIRDTIHATFDEKVFERAAALLAGAAARQIKAPDEALIEVVGEDLGFSQAERASILEAYVEQNDRTQFGLVSAINGWARIEGQADGVIDDCEEAAGEAAAWSPDEVEALAKLARAAAK